MQPKKKALLSQISLKFNKLSIYKEDEVEFSIKIDNRHAHFKHIFSNRKCYFHFIIENVR